MKQSIRQTAKHERGVGSDIIAAIIPYTATMSDRVIVTGMQGKNGFVFSNSEIPKQFRHDLSEASIFLRFPEGRDSGVYVAPNIAARGFAYMTPLYPLKGEFRHDFHFRAGPDGKVSAIVASKHERPTRRTRK
jgi:hypothetical protein